MVASSRSSLRRPAPRGDQNAAQEISPVNSDTLQHSPSDGLHSKRSRLASVSDRDQLQKRRRIAAESEPPPAKVQIPLRGREVHAEVLPTIKTRTLPVISTATQTSSSTTSPLDSPSTKPQYDQIKRIEEKARAAIRKESSKPGQKDDRRRLRSEHGGTRTKTELAQYFPAFDDMLSLDPPRPDILTPDNRLILIDDTLNLHTPAEHSDPFGAKKPPHNANWVDLQTILTVGHVTYDPLGPEVYYKAHRKAERHEKQMKNGDKERAQHEKYQLERLLDELRGPDWLKTLGITGVTDTEKKRYEPKRSLFVRETRALINKFKRWKEEEKRRKLEKEQAMREGTEEAEVDTETAASMSTRKLRKRGSGHISTRSHSVASSEQIPDSSEIDLLASQQLLQEVKVASTRRKKTSIVVDVVLAAPPPAHKPFTSFFSKRHIRDAAIAGRQRGRLVLAFGEPVPELQESDFELPESILTADAIRASQRNRRRTKRSTDE